MSTVRVWCAVVLGLAAVGCASAPPAVPVAAPAPVARMDGTQQARLGVASPVSAEALGLYRPAEARGWPLSEDEGRVLASAKTLVGRPPNAKVVVNGRTFVLDCIGTVSAIYYGLYVDVTKDFARFPGNGVNRLYQSLKEKAVLHSDTYPRPGDAVFWDNTWDANGDGNFDNDPRTHAGIVLAVDDDGTVHYVHSHIRRGVIVERMNLLRPTVYKDEAGKEINSFLALTSGLPVNARPTHVLSGDIFNTFGDVLKKKTYYQVAGAELNGETVGVEIAQGSRNH